MNELLVALALVVAVMYVVLAAWVVPRLAGLAVDGGRSVLVAKYGAMAFLLGCAATHLNIALHSIGERGAGAGGSSPSVVLVGHVVPHIAQIVGGVVFIVIASRTLDIRIASKNEAERIRDLESRLDHALEAGGMGAWDINLVTGETWHSPHHDRVFGYDSPIDRWNRVVFLDHVVSDDRRYVEEQFEQALDSGGMSLECRIDRPDGAERWIAIEGTVVRYDEAAPVLTGTVADVTDRRRRYAERDSMEQQLHQVRRMEAVGRLAGGVAHDFNNLLTVINGWAELALQEDPGPVRTELEAIAAAGDRGRQLTDQLLAMSRPETSGTELAQVNALVTESSRMLSRLIDTKISIEHELDSRVGYALIDPGHLSQILLNLALNARDAMPDGGVLRFATQLVERDDARPDDWLVLTVSDSGEGMSDETRARIFEPFFTTKDVGVGTGLGLATVFNLVAGAGGEIAVDSRPGQGSIFTIGLPASRAIPPRAAVQGSNRTPVAVPAMSNSTSVLLVEDDDDVRALVSATLVSAGYRVADVDGPTAALELDVTTFDLLVSDVSMPTMNGHQLADELTGRHESLRVLLMSALPNSMENASVSRSFLKKPFTPDGLLAAVRSTLEATPS